MEATKVTNEIKSNVFKYAHKIWKEIRTSWKAAKKAATKGITTFAGCLKEAWAVARKPVAAVKQAVKKSNVAKICGEIKRETAAAILISVAFDLVRSEEVSRDMWFPKSQIKSTGKKVFGRYNELDEFEIPSWLANQKLAEVKETCVYIANFA